MSQTADAFQDLYALLGVAFEATFDEIKSAFRRMAKRYHPDLNPDDPEESAARFRLINRAYEVLSDPSLRRQYDREWQRFRNAEEPPEPPGPAAQVSATDWDFACRYFPHLERLSERLTKFSDMVERRWRNLVFFDKTFDRADELARTVEEAFLGQMVGTSEVLRMVARDALLASHEKLLAELANALRIFGSEQAEKIVPDICKNALGNERPPVTSYDLDLRSERYRGFTIDIKHDLWCRVQKKDQAAYSYMNNDYHDEAFPYIFAAKDAIDRGDFEPAPRRRK